MAGISLAQSVKMTQNELQAGVIEILATESKLLNILPFMNVVGSGYSYNVENNLGSASFRNVNEKYNATELTTDLRTEALVILGDEAVVDTFQIATHSNINDLMAIEVALRTKAIAHKYEKTFVQGKGDTKDFKGILYRYLHSSANEVQEAQVLEATESIIDDIDVLLDSVLGGADCLIMNKKTRRALTKLARNSCEYKQGEFGTQFTLYGGIPIVDLEGDLLEDNIVIACRLGVKEAVCGLQNGSIVVTPLGQMEGQPQLKTRLEWFCGMAIFNDKTVAIRKPSGYTDMDS
ncbi:MAG: capsid family protein [Bacteriophage sp.]|nr:MAG: capsid family protein [Bacteriophage sp.]